MLNYVLKHKKALPKNNIQDRLENEDEDVQHHNHKRPMQTADYLYPQYNKSNLVGETVDKPTIKGYICAVFSMGNN